MTTPIPGSIVIPMLGVPGTLASIDAHAVAAAAACVGASLVLALFARAVLHLQDHGTTHRFGSRFRVRRLMSSTA